MTQQTINVGAAPNDGTGDPARTSFQKVNSNFTELYATTTGITSATTGQVLYANGGVAAGAAGLTYTLATGNVSVAAPVSGAALTSYGTILFGAANPALVFNIGGAQIYSTLANTLQFSSDGTPTERMRIGSAGNVTINAPSSGAALTVAGQVKVTPASGAAAIDGVYAGTATGSTLGSLRFYGSGGGVTGEVDVTGVLETGSLVNSACLFYTALSGSLTEKMRLDSSGNLGLGVTPSASLHLKQSTTSGLKIESVSNDSSLSLYNSSGTEFRIAASYGTTGSFQPIVFYTSDLARMTLDTSGNLLVGAASVGSTAAKIMSYGATNTNNLYVSQDTGTSYSTNNYFFTCYNSSSAIAGGIQHTGASTVTFATASDYRLKTDVVDLTGSGAFVDGLRPVAFTWIEDQVRDVGFIAHEAQVVAPHSAGGVKDAVDADGKPVYQTMAYGSAEIIANLVAELQDLRKRLAALEAK